MTTAALPALLLQNAPLLVLGVTAAARIGLPVPAAALMVATGALAAAGSWSAATVLGLVGLSVLANLLGDGVWFLAGRHQSTRVMRAVCRGKPEADCAEGKADALRRWGDGALLAAKFIPGISAVAPPMAGAMGMSVRRFVVVESASALVWTLAFMGLGALFGREIERLLVQLSDSGAALWSVAALVAGGAALALAMWRRKSSSSSSSSEGGGDDSAARRTGIFPAWLAGSSR
jgi:membrane protein DedA with SNARE-associated domain